MRFLLTLNMPSAAGMLVHQVTIELEKADSCKAFCNLLNQQEFISGRQWYRYKSNDGEITWEDRGDVIINTSHIGKIQEFVEMGDKKHDESYRGYEPSRGYAEVTRKSVRSR